MQLFLLLWGAIFTIILELCFYVSAFVSMYMFQVNTLLSSARMRLHNAREEREHFDEASSQMLVHLKTKVIKLLVVLLFELISSFNKVSNRMPFIFSLPLVSLMIFFGYRKMSCSNLLLHIK